MFGGNDYADFNEIFSTNEYLDEISQESSHLIHHSYENQKLRDQNEQLKTSLKKIRLSTKEVIEIYKSERQKKEAVQRDLETLTTELTELRNKYEELEKLSTNNQFSNKEQIDVLELQTQNRTESQRELAEDYLDLLKETTLFYNYEIKRDRHKIINKTSNFLQEILGEKFKRPHFITKRSTLKNEAKSTASSKRTKSLTLQTNTKRRKLDIWEMKSISELTSPAQSPASFHDDGSIDMSEAFSNFTCNTFSIGNETSFSLLQSKKSKFAQSTQTLTQCKCNFEEDTVELVSIGVNTENPNNIVFPSVPLLDDDDFMLENDHIVSSTINNDDADCADVIESNTVNEKKSSEAVGNSNEVMVKSNENVANSSLIDEISSKADDKSNEVEEKSSENKETSSLVEEIPEIPPKTYCDQSTSYECITIDKSTSYEFISNTIDKSTSTVHSVTHRGTSTPVTVSKNFGMQYPEISFDKIMEEMSFDFPDLLAPIEEIAKITRETQTELSNVNRELNFVENSNELKKNAAISSEEQSFVVLGQTIFNLFLNRLRESNKSFHDDARTREKLWPYLRQQLMDRFDELTFDEFFNSSNISESSSQEDMQIKLFEEVKDMKLKRNVCVKEVKSVEIEIRDATEELSTAMEIFDDLRVSSSESSIVSDHKEILLEKSHSDGNLSEMSEMDEDLSENLTDDESLSEQQQQTNSFEQLFTSSKEIQAAEPILSSIIEVEVPETKEPSIPEDEESNQLTTIIEEPKLPSIIEPDLPTTEIQPDLPPIIESNVSSTIEKPEPPSTIEPTVVEPDFTEISQPNSPEPITDDFTEISQPNSSEPITDDFTEISQPNSPEPITDDLNISDDSDVESDIREIEQILSTIKSLGSHPLELISPILDYEDVVWSSIFPNCSEINEEHKESPEEDPHVLDDFDVSDEPIDIPLEFIESPDEPPYFNNIKQSLYVPQLIPMENAEKNHGSTLDGNCSNVLQYNHAIRMRLVKWQQMHTVMSFKSDKRLCKMRKTIKCYLDGEWTDENCDACVNELTGKCENVLIEAIFETVEDYKWDKEINTEFTPPAPPLPRYQQKLIGLINNLAEINPKLPHLLMADLDTKLFKFDNLGAFDLDYLRNISYYYTALMDLFFEGNTTMVFYFIVKCLYFHGCKAIPMVFVLVKAFPNALPKKSTLIKKHSPKIDWESITGLEMARVKIEFEWVDSLDLCVMYLLTNNKIYRTKQTKDTKIICEHELFNYLPKYYGFAANFITVEKLLDFLIKRIEIGELTNLSFSLILLGKRMSIKFTKDTMMRGKLIPLLKKYVDKAIQSNEIEVDKICLLVEAISTILKPLNEEKERSFKEIFPMIVNILGRLDNQQIQECCIQAILRLQRFFDNHKEIYEIIKSHCEKQNSFSETLRHAIVTFVHRKNENYFKN